MISPRIIRSAVTAALLLLVSTPAVQASLLTNYVGVTYPSFNPTFGLSGVDGHILFAVYSRDGNGSDPFNVGNSQFDSSFVQGTGSGALDTSANFLYLFEVINDGTNTATTLEKATVSTEGKLFGPTSYGQFATTTGGYQFTDGTGAGTHVIGSNPSTYWGATVQPGNPPPAPGYALAVNAGLVGVATSSTAVQLTSVTYVGGTKSGVVREVSNEVNGASTVIWGYTSKYAPIVGSATIQDGHTANGVVFQSGLQDHVMTTPEPSSSALLGLGAISMAIFRRRQTLVA